MTQKENKGGMLSNKQIEQDLKAKGKTNEEQTGHVGLQDTGDRNVRQLGTEIQQNDGWDKEDKEQ